MSQPEQLRERTKQFALRIIRLFRALPRSEEARIDPWQAVAALGDIDRRQLPRSMPRALKSRVHGQARNRHRRSGRDSVLAGAFGRRWHRC